MKVEKLIIKDHPELLSYIENFEPSKVVLSDYFYFSTLSFVSNSEIYNEKQIARILHLTDKEYSELVQRYFSEETSTSPKNTENLELQKKLDEINLKLSNSNVITEAQRRISEIEEEIKELDKELGVASSLEEKLNQSQAEFDKYKHLARFNLQKIHDDLVKINAEITKFEEQLLNQKVVDIKEGRSYYDYDKGKIGLAVGVGLAFAIIGGIFLTINSPQWIVFVIWGIGFLIAAGLVFTSKYKVVGDYASPEDTYDYSDIQEILEKFRAQRNSILKLLGIKTTDDFFLIKARFASAKKNLDNLATQKESMIGSLNPVSAKRKDELEKELVGFKQKAEDKTNLLTSEQYLQLYRESDGLKLKLGQKNNVSTIEKADIPKRLSDIRKELADKLPQYIKILKSTFESAFDSIYSKLKNITTQSNISPIETTKDLNNWETLDIFSKTLIQYSIAAEIYKQDFAFAIEDSESWDEESKQKLEKFVEIEDTETKSNIYILNNA